MPHWVFMACISNHIPQKNVICNCLSMSHIIPILCTQVLNFYMTGIPSVLTSNEACHPGTHYRNYCPGTLSCYTPCFNGVEGGYTGFMSSVRLSVCGQNRVRSVSSIILVGSISYLHFLLSNFRRCVACKGYCIILKFDCNHEAARGISERRHSSCSSFIQFTETHLKIRCQ